MSFHIGIDLGGTKILGLALDETGLEHCRTECLTPRGDYQATLQAIATIVTGIEVQLGGPLPVGVGMPGSLVPHQGVVQNANSTWLNGQAFGGDLNETLNREVRLANDANCFALSEAADGAGTGAACLFGVIMGTGVGGGLIINGAIVNGPRSIGGEWGHCSLPFPLEGEVAGAPACWCGQRGCIEAWISGPALIGQYNLQSPLRIDRVEEIVIRAHAGETYAQDILAAHAGRTARALSMVVNILDPEVIVLGGGLSGIDALYEQLPHLMAPFIFSDAAGTVDIRRPAHGAASGVRGAARLWQFA